MATMFFHPDIIIVGAGPTGLFTACRLILLGKRVLVLERDQVLAPNIRALGYYGPTQYALQKAGIFEECRDRGSFQLCFSWRKMTRSIGPDEKAWGELIAAWNPWEDSTMKPGDCGYGMLVLGQDGLRDICMKKLQASPLAQVLLGHTVTGLVQADDSATVSCVDHSGATTTFGAQFVIGADGGKSTIRKMIGQTLEGYTWPMTLVAVDIEADIVPPADEPPVIYIIDKDDIAFFSPLQGIRYDGPNFYRFTLPMPPEECEPAVFMENLRKRVDMFFPGKRPLHYTFKNAQTYKTHQRQVATYIVGRTVILGDAAHLNTPWGGLGLTTGLLDADALGDAFEHIFKQGRPWKVVLQAWADARHRVWKEFVNPISTANQLRCLNVDPDKPKEDPFLRTILEKGPELRDINEAFSNTMITRMEQIVS